ncbi:hypothetical protein CERZMDRAFT_91333 [Cercospora zeae-maydis SCOH1-5]|uniref:Tim44-like domain-containing protein n=1 Tax=Cercospora zeae-maydis SCOH1-5 TaxID=717836 RepID=A0A6A6F6H2_9PEZI|nr:hypothetical protein CERZMDRAFT_91333 [Cercospora zeae-maydis SCOH1-5]
MAGGGFVKAQPSMAVKRNQAMKKMQASGEVLDYVGLLQETFVPPRWENLPSIFSDFSGHRKLLWYRWKAWISFRRSQLTAFWMVKPRLKLEVRKTPHIAKQLYEEMYVAFADGNLGSVEAKLSPGFKTRLEQRIAKRAPNTRLQWKLHKYIGRPKCVSYMFAMPDTKGPNTTRTAIMQAVVRIKSQQSLLHVRKQRVKDPATGKFVVVEVPVDRDGKEIRDFNVEAEEKKNTKTMVEYFVIERTLINGQVGSWRAWGTTQEADLAELRKAEIRKEKALMGTM